MNGGYEVSVMVWLCAVAEVWVRPRDVPLPQRKTMRRGVAMEGVGLPG